MTGNDFELDEIRAKPEDYLRGRHGRTARRDLTRADKPDDRRYARIPLRTAADLGKAKVFNWPAVILIHLINWSRFNDGPMPTTTLATGCPSRKARHFALRALEKAGTIEIRKGPPGQACTVSLAKHWTVT